MDRLQLAVTPLKILLVAMFAALLVHQVVILPEALDRLIDEEPALADLRWPLLGAATLGLVAVQVVVVCIWTLLSLVTTDRIFSDGSLVWVDVIVWALALAWVLLLAVFGMLVATIGFPGLPGVLLLMLLAGGVLGLLMVVMRALLRQATTLRDEMAAVI